MAQATITYNSNNIRTSIDGLKITNITKPALAPKTKTLVEVPGRDYPYDFGNNYKTSFNIKVDIIIEAHYDADNIAEEDNIETKISSLNTFLDYDSSQALVIDGNTYQAQVYDGVDMNINKTRNLATGTITFVCYA